MTDVLVGQAHTSGWGRLGGVHPDAAKLESIVTALELLTEQVVAIADSHRDDPDDLLTAQLDELERALRSATRRLQRTVKSL